MKKSVLFFLLFFLLPKITFSKELPISINQIMIGQEISAKNEFIELYNPNDFTINMQGFALKKKSSSGNESVLISEKFFKGEIGAKSYFLISSPEFCQEIQCDLSYSTKNSLSKNNSILLYDNNKKILDKIGYGDSSDFFQEALENPDNNQCFKKIHINTEEPNNKNDYKIQENYIEIRNSKNKIIKINNFREELLEEKSVKNSKEKNLTFVDLKSIKKTKSKDLVITEGIVSCLPQELGSQYFYIHEKDEDGVFYGIQIYNYNKKFIDLKIGDRIRVKGEISINEDLPNYNYKLKTKELDDIEIIKNEDDLGDPKIEKINELKIEHSGFLKKVSGEISQNKTKQIYLDDGSGEILIEVKSGTKINSKILKEGSKFEIVGILNYKKSEAIISPLKSSGIKNLSEDQEESIGEILNEDFWELEDKKNKNEFIKYLIAIIIIFIIYLLFGKKIKEKL